MTLCSDTFNFYLWLFSNTTGINQAILHIFEIPGRFQFVKMMIMSYGLKTLELSPLCCQ